MPNPEHLAILKKGVEAWNPWRKEHPEIVPDLSEANLRWADLQEANLLKANLQGAKLQEANLRGAKLQEANLRGAKLFGAKLLVANLRKADLRGAKLKGAKLQGANLQGANLQEADLQGADLQEANLQGAILRKVNLQAANLQAANLRGAKLFGAKLLVANLRKADLRGAELQEANLWAADLWAANLQEADLRGANLRKTNLRVANLQGADLQGADLRVAVLRRVVLHWADLRKARLVRTRFSSRSVLNDLAHPLTDEQLAGAIFEDEQEFYSKAKRETPREAPTLRIRFDDDKPWDAARFGIFFATLHTAYARLLFLATTEEEDGAAIRRVLDRNSYHLPPEQDIYLQSVSTGTLTAEFFNYLSDPANLNAAANAASTVLKGLGAFLGGFAATLVAIPTFQEKRANTRLTNLKAEKLRRELEEQQRPTERDESITRGFYVPSLTKPFLVATQDVQKDTSLAQEALETMDLKQVMLVLEPRSKTVRDNPELVAHAARELSLSVTDLAKLGKPPTVVKTGTRGDDASPGT